MAERSAGGCACLPLAASPGDGLGEAAELIGAQLVFLLDLVGLAPRWLHFPQVSFLVRVLDVIDEQVIESPFPASSEYFLFLEEFFKNALVSFLT